MIDRYEPQLKSYQKVRACRSLILKVNWNLLNLLNLFKELKKFEYGSIDATDYRHRAGCGVVAVEKVPDVAEVPDAVECQQVTPPNLTGAPTRRFGWVRTVRTAVR